MFTVYAIYSEKIDCIYIGQTSNLEQRLRSHNEYAKGFTARADDWIIIYSEEYSTRTEALKRERQLKTGSGRRFLRDLL